MEQPVRRTICGHVSGGRKEGGGAAYNLSQRRKDGLGDNLAIVLRCQVALGSTVLGTPVTEAELVHGVVVKQPVEDKSRVTVVRLVRHVVVPGNLLGAGKENTPGARGLFQAVGLVATTRGGWRDVRAVHLKSVE